MGYVYLNNFQRIGRVDPDGYIYSENFDRLGRIQSDGRIYGKNLDYIGRIDNDGFIYLANMKRIGRIHRDGDVYDELFNRVGKLDSDIVKYIFDNSSSTVSSNTTSSYSNDSSRCASGITGAGVLATITGLIAGIYIGNTTSSFGIGFIAFWIVYTLVGCLVDGIKNSIGIIFFGIIIVLITLCFMN